MSIRKETSKFDTVLKLFFLWLTGVVFGYTWAWNALGC